MDENKKQNKCRIVISCFDAIQVSMMEADEYMETINQKGFSKDVFQEIYQNDDFVEETDSFVFGDSNFSFVTFYNKTDDEYFVLDSDNVWETYSYGEFVKWGFEKYGNKHYMVSTNKNIGTTLIVDIPLEEGEQFDPDCLGFYQVNDVAMDAFGVKSKELMQGYNILLSGPTYNGELVPVREITHIMIGDEGYVTLCNKDAMPMVENEIEVSPRIRPLYMFTLEDWECDDE